MPTKKVMAGDMLNSGDRRTTYLVLTILLLSSLPLISNASADQGIPEELQAQDIYALFDNVSETTTVQWRNIDDTGSNPDLYSDLWDATYHVYRHNVPITAGNILSLNAWHSVTACDSDIQTQSLSCRGEGGANPHPGHSATFQVGAGTNGSFFYAVTTELANGSMSTTLDINASTLYEPVIEIATPIRSPYNIVASFDSGSSQTSVQWINYNSLNPVLPESGDDALEIHVWSTEYEVNRSNGQNMLVSETPIATLSPTATMYSVDVPPMTNREVFYSVTYLLPNWTIDNLDYEDSRFLSNNALSNAILEDNTPPDDVTTVEALFTPNENGTGVTHIIWDDILSEENEQYRVYRHGEYFSSTDNAYVQLIGTVQEGVSSFEYNIPFNTYGDFVYCVVVVDQFGASNPFIPASACDIVSEDADGSWVKEPTNVNATFIGDGKTRITWTDQFGIEGERYHIWRAGYRVTGAEFVQNQSLFWMGSVSDGIEQFDVQLDEDISASNVFYFVTSEALYNCPGCNGTMMYSELNQNWAGPISEDTEAPQPARISDIMMIGGLQVVDLEWINSAQEVGESYSIYRHFGDPFGDSEFAISNYTDAGWEYVEGPVTETGFSTMVRQIPVLNDTQRDVWYTIIMADSYGNINEQIFPGIGGNAVKISEDTKAPGVSYAIHDENNIPLVGTSLIRGDYTLRIELSEMLDEFPIVNISTANGGSLTGGSEQAMILLSLNTNDPDKGPQYFQTFSISSSAVAGDLFISINMTDLSMNSIERVIDDFSVDAQAPVVNIFSPTSANDGAMYLYGNDIKVVGGASDDVEVVSMQMRFVQNYGTSSTVTEPWRDVTGLSINDDGDWTFEMIFSSGNFLPGIHEVSVKAIDSAGNERTQKVQFLTDWCRHRDDGSTICEYTNPVKDEPEVIYPELNATDPPYMIAWVASGISFLAVLASLFVISAAMSGPKKKKGEEDDEGDEWMNEFIGTSAEPDMGEITGGEPTAESKTQSAVETDEEDDPFAVNQIKPKRRRKKAAEDEDDDDDDDDEEEEDMDWEEGKSPKKKKRRAVGRKKVVKRKKS